MIKLKNALRKKYRGVDSIFISSFVPRKCGIATYTRDLVGAIDIINPNCEVEIMAMDRPEDGISYPPEVVFKINQHDAHCYRQAARHINKSRADVIVLEHEFGLYGGKFGEYINEMAKLIKKPLIITTHTIPDNPDIGYGAALKEIIEFADSVIVMMPESIRKLAKKYKYPEENIELIPHGVPDILMEPVERYKEKKGLKKRIILGNINLLSEVKGIEYIIEALQLIKKQIPNVLYLMIGQTHPVVLKEEGEKYRNFLKKKIKELGLEENARFINKYMSLDELVRWLKAIDIYITPYLDPHQSASGALAYAIGAGKACISTPYMYAKEILANGRGVLVPFRNSRAIASAVIDICKNPEKKLRIEKEALKFGKMMTWPNVALQHFQLFNRILGRQGIV
jgi:polysaccharide biosynthesis protein PslF